MKTTSSNRTPINVIEDLQDLRLKFANIISIAFLDHPDFQRGLKTAFETFINRDSRVSRFLSIYLDNLMKSHPMAYRDGEIGSQELTLQNRINNVIHIFRY